MPGGNQVIPEVPGSRFGLWTILPSLRKLRPAIPRGLAPAQLLHRLLAVASDDGPHVRAGGEPLPGVPGRVPSPEKDEGPRRDGPDLLADELHVALPVDGEADQVRLRAKEVRGPPGLLPQVDDVDPAAARLEHRGDQLETDRRQRAGITGVVTVGIYAEGMLVHGSVPPAGLLTSFANTAWRRGASRSRRGRLPMSIVRLSSRQVKQ